MWKATENRMSSLIDLIGVALMSGVLVFLVADQDRCGIVGKAFLQGGRETLCSCAAQRVWE
jgi:hypothetical protein